MTSERAREHARDRSGSRPDGPRLCERRTRRRALVVLGLLLALAVLDAIWVGTTVTRELRAARDQLAGFATAS